MANFITGKKLSKAVREIVSSPKLRCAVAFWGSGAVEDLFGATPLKRSDVWIVCDLSMGGTNPQTLRALGAPESEQLGHVPGLHAKVYHSDGGMVVGSCNASENGIGFSPYGAQLVEAGLFVEAGTKGWRAARTWFDHLWDESDWIDDIALESAERAWQRRSLAGRQFAPPPNRQRPGLLEALRDHPEIFGDIKFVLSAQSYSPEEKDEADEEAALEGYHPDRSRVEYFSADRIPANEWPLRFINLHRPGSKIRAYFHTRGNVIGSTHFANKESFRHSEHFDDLRRQVSMQLDGAIIEEGNLDDLFDDYGVMSAIELSRRLFPSSKT